MNVLRNSHTWSTRPSLCVIEKLSLLTFEALECVPCIGWEPVPVSLDGLADPASLPNSKCVALRKRLLGKDLAQPLMDGGLSSPSPLVLRMLAFRGTFLLALLTPCRSDLSRARSWPVRQGLVVEKLHPGVQVLSDCTLFSSLVSGTCYAAPSLPPVLGGAPLIKEKPSLVGWRPLLVGWRPWLLGWRPSLVGWRPSLLG